MYDDTINALRVCHQQEAPARSPLRWGFEPSGGLEEGSTKEVKVESGGGCLPSRGDRCKGRSGCLRRHESGCRPGTKSHPNALLGKDPLPSSPCGCWQDSVLRGLLG